jgi:rubredoxin
MNLDGEGNLEERTCPRCGKEKGELINRREWVLGKSSRWMNEFKCKSCGHEWDRQAEDQGREARTEED